MLLQYYTQNGNWLKRTKKDILAVFWNSPYSGSQWLTERHAEYIAARCCLEGGECVPTPALVAYVQQLFREYHNPALKADLQAIMSAPR